MDNMPETITALKTITYDVPRLVQSIAETNELPEDTVSAEQIIEAVREMAHQELAVTDSIYLFDQEGNALD